MKFIITPRVKYTFRRNEDPMPPAELEYALTMKDDEGTVNHIGVYASPVDARIMAGQIMELDFTKQEFELH